ncbi:hypothetical protein [Bradyrhizobium sp. B117]|uniref:DUF6894 family protein n=1 Tax=Bradyrhizobium sp. B117 TaxID=3140246 RepID=UPI003184220B
MPRYFFHVRREQRQIDKEGEELPDERAARNEATMMAGQMLQGMAGQLQPGSEWRMEVADEFQNVLFVLHVKAEKPSSDDR